MIGLRRIVCLTSVLYGLGQPKRIAGMPGFTVRPLPMRRGKTQQGQCLHLGQDRRDRVYTWAMHTHLLDQARQLSVQDQLALVEALWDDIAKRNVVPPSAAAQVAELQRRLADHEADPDDVVPWGEVKASALARLGR